MSSTNKTTHYELPQFVENDIFNPLVDDNDAYAKIDTALYNIADAEADDAAEIVAAKGRLDTVEGKVGNLETQNGTDVLTTVAQTLSGAVNELKSGEDSLDGRLDVVEDDINNVSTGLKAKVTALETQNGNSALTTTAQTLSGAVNELDAEDAAISGRIDGIINTTLPKYLKKEYLTNEVTKYLYDGYCIYVTKVKEGAKPKVDVVAADKYFIADKALELEASICLNAGLFNTTTGVPAGNAIKDGVVVAESVTDHQCVCFKDDGEMGCVGGSVPTANILSNGYTQCLPVWGSIVKDGVVDSISIASFPSSLADETSQQNIAVDTSGNYYIITTSYNCPLDMSDIAAWIIANIPNVKDAVSLDGGGSTATVVNGIQINSISDFGHSDGRRINGIIYFENENKGETDNSLMGLSRTIDMLRAFINPVVLINNYDSSTDESRVTPTGVRLYNFNVYQMGNLVLGHGLINIASSFTDTGWVQLTGKVLPRNASGGRLFPMIRAYSDETNIKTGRIDIGSAAGQTEANAAHMEMRVALSNPTENLGDFDFWFVYITSQDKTK